jgi:hypothetical protein
MSRHDPASGDLRLLHDLAVLGLVADPDRVPAAERLERLVGADFARVIRRSVDRRGPPSGWQARDRAA